METIMSDLLKEAIADAKAVRETALQNAKMALEEAFTPHLKSMLSAKLAEDDIEEDDNPFADNEEDDEEEAEEGMDNYREEDDEEEMADEEEVDESEIVEIDGVKYAPIVSEEDEEEMDDDEEVDESEELDLEAVIKELEQEIAEADDSDEDLTEGPDDEEEEKVSEEVEEITEEDDEDEDKDDVDEQSTPESEEDTKVHESVNAMQTELNEYKEAVTYLRDKLHEVNILNAKLLYTNRLFKEFALSNNQKMKIVETFDRAQTTREIKLVYSTLAESYKDTGSVKKNDIKEFASKKAGTTAPKTKIISEENQVADRFKKLAGILND
jgi:hypothetical protein|tara:strand:- start:756 stop:1733 length:978 start_codon:yes stop_codon:yes gene_type:complete